MQHPLPKKLPDFSQINIAVVGDIMLDRYWFGDTSRISPEAPVPIVKIAGTEDRPGGAGNVALNIAALGGKATLLGFTGTDEASDTLERQLQSAEVAHDICKLDSLSTIIKLRVISRHQQLLRLDFEDAHIAANSNLLAERLKKHLSNCQLIVLSDYKKGTLDNPQNLIQLARDANIPVLVDPKGSDFSIYRHATIITPNFKEFETIVGTCQSEQAILEKGRTLLKELDIKTLLVTRGEDGMTLITENDSAHIPAYAREVFDVTGAGDTVIATLAAAIASGLDPIESMGLANLAASLVVGKLGAATVSTPELEAALTGKTNFATGIVNDEQLVDAVKQARTQGKKVVFTNGCYDIIHAGHVTSLQLAKQLGDFLIVAVNTDDSIRKLKGPSRPINNLDHRMTVLAGLDVVDWVIPFADDTPERLLKLIKPDVLAKGSDYNIDQVVGADIVRGYGGEVRIVTHNVKMTSTRIFDLLQQTPEPALEGES